MDKLKHFFASFLVLFEVSSLANAEDHVIMIDKLMSECKIKTNRASQRIKKRSDITNKEKVCLIGTNVEIQPSMEQITGGENIIQNTVQCFCKKITKMKEEALEKATQMIELLYQEKKELQKELNNLKVQLIAKENMIQQLYQQIQELTIKQESYTPQRNVQCQQWKEKENVVANDIFFSFSQPKNKSKDFKGKSTTDRSTIEIKPGLTISRQFQPWQTPQNIIETLAEVISHQEESINQFKEINKLVRKQLQQSENLNNQFQYQKLQIQDDLNLLQHAENEQSQEKLTTVQSEARIQSTHDLIHKYEDIICRFRQYSAFLKASLCEATNFISKIAVFISTITSFQQNTLTQLSSILQDFKSNFDPMNRTHEQNKQLRTIIEALVQNIEVLKANIKIE